MIERLHSIAKILFPLRHVFMVGAVAASLYGGFRLLSPDPLADDSGFLFALVVFIWCGLLFSVIQIFRNTPPQIEVETGIIQRTLSKLRRGLYWLVAVLMILVTVLVVVASFQFLRIAITGY